MWPKFFFFASVVFSSTQVYIETWAILHQYTIHELFCVVLSIKLIHANQSKTPIKRWLHSAGFHLTLGFQSYIYLVFIYKITLLKLKCANAFWLTLFRKWFLSGRLNQLFLRFLPIAGSYFDPLYIQYNNNSVYNYIYFYTTTNMP